MRAASSQPVAAGTCPRPAILLHTSTPQNPALPPTTPPTQPQTAFQDRRILQAGAEVGVYTAAGYMLQSMGLFTTDASRASFLSTFTVLVVPFLVGLTPGRSVRPITWGASLAALAGVSLLEQSGTQPSLGDLWSFLSAVAFGFQVRARSGVWWWMWWWCGGGWGDVMVVVVAPTPRADVWGESLQWRLMSGGWRV